MDRAREALKELREADAEERGAIIDRNERLWRELKDVLERINHGKCWYCEAQENRSDNTVDHFRPKKRVAEAADHPGYWWLAFEWSNFRYTCTYCNSRRVDPEGNTEGGKQNHFPLLNEAQRAYDENDDLTLEEPKLLDPLNALDHLLLWFTDDGRAVPRYDEQSHQRMASRASCSIATYHLNHRRLVDKRKMLYNFIHRHVESGKRNFARAVEGDISAEQALDDGLRVLMGLMSSTAEHSAAARAILSGLRHTDHPWIEQLVEAAA